MEDFNLSKENLNNQWKNNKRFKLGVYIGAGIIGSLVLFLAYRQLIWAPADTKADDGWWSALNYIEKDSTDQAIRLLVPFVKKYDGHTGGEIGQYLLGTQYMKKGEFQKALDQLEGVSVDDTYLATMIIGLQGDCLSELKNTRKRKKNTSKRPPISKTSLPLRSIFSKRDCTLSCQKITREPPLISPKSRMNIRITPIKRRLRGT